MRYYTQLNADEISFISQRLVSLETESLLAIADNFDLVCDSRETALNVLLSFYAKRLRPAINWQVRLPNGEIRDFTDLSDAAIFSSNNKGELTKCQAQAESVHKHAI